MNNAPINSENIASRIIRRTPASLDLAQPLRAPRIVVREVKKLSLAVDYYRTLKRWRWAIMLCAVAGILLSFLFTLTSLPIYRARTSLQIQSVNNDFMNMRAIAPTGGSLTGDEDVQTQIKLLQSDTLLDRVVDHLLSQPHLKTVERGDFISNLKRNLHLSHTEPLAYVDLVEFTAKSVKIKPLGVTRLVEITCDSWSSAFAAKFCNNMVTEYRAADLETRSTEADKTSDWLTRQVADVRVKAEESEKKLEAATGGNGLILSTESNSVGEDRLRQIQGELVKAEADRIEKEAQSSIASTSATETLPSVLDSAIYRSYSQKLAELQNSVAQLIPPLTEENPKVIHLRSQIREVESGMARERFTDTSRMKNEFDAARHREALLKAAYQAEEATVSSDLGKVSKVTLLRREVESEQQLYQTLLQRAKEAGFASAMQATTVRTVDAAKQSRVPISPQRGTSAGIGFLLGSLCGIGLAFFKERNSEVFRTPGEIERRLQVQELGVIPSSKMNGKNTILHAIRGIRSLASKSESEMMHTDPIGITKWNENTFSIAAEAYRSTTFSILLSEYPGGLARTYVVSSPNAGEGKTTVTSNLGIALSKSKLRVLLVDGDLRKPGLHKALRVDNSFGLRNILRGEVDINHEPLSRFCKKTSINNLSLLPSGSGREEVVELLHSPDVRILLNRLSREFDVIMIDTPPMLHMSDARILASLADGVILIFRAGVTTHDQAANAVDLFEHDRVRLIGTILNDFNPQREGKTGYYDSYYRYKEQIESIVETAGKS